MCGVPKFVAEALAVDIAVQLMLQHDMGCVGDFNFGLSTPIWEHAMRTFTFDHKGLPPVWLTPDL